MIPQEKSAAVAHALREAFGVTEFEDIRELTGGLGANPVFRIVVRGSAFLLRINLRAGDVARQYTCMRAAAEAGVTPRVWYTNVEDRIAITDFVEIAPFPITEALVRIPASLRVLHALPAFGEVPSHFNSTCLFLVNKGPALDGFLEKFRAAANPPQNESEEFFARYEQLAAVYARHDVDMVSSHNDLFKPDNMLFDGRRLWLVDWEAAFLNDRYADLAVVANMIVSNEAEETSFLREYFGMPPDEFQVARLFLTQQLAHMFYAMVFLWQGAAGKPIDWSESTPDFSDFRQRYWSGESTLKDSHAKTAYGRFHWEQLLQNARQPRFEKALRIVSDRHAKTAP